MNTAKDSAAGTTSGCGRFITGTALTKVIDTGTIRVRPVPLSPAIQQRRMIALKWRFMLPSSMNVDVSRNAPAYVFEIQQLFLRENLPVGTENAMLAVA